MSTLEIKYYATVTRELIEDFNIDQRFLIDPNTSCILATCNNTPAAIMLFGKTVRFFNPFDFSYVLKENHIYAHNLVVKQEFRSQGIAKILYQTSFDVFKNVYRYFDIFVNADRFIPNKAVDPFGFEKVKSVFMVKIFMFKISIFLHTALQERILERFLISLQALLYLSKTILKPLMILLRMPSVLYNSLFTKIYIVQDARGNSNSKVAFVSKKLFDDILLQKIFPHSYKIIETKRIEIFKWKEELDKISSTVDAVIMEGRFNDLKKKHSQFQGSFLIPQWIVQRNRNFTGFSHITNHNNRSAYSDIKKAKHYGYTYEFSKDPAMLEFFYNEMYLPYIKIRHQDTPFIRSFGLLRDKFKKGGLLFVKDKNKYITASLIIFDKFTLISENLGVLNGNFDLVKKGAVSSSYYFNFKFAHEKNITDVNLGFSRPFLNDGVLRQKAKWNAALEYSTKKCSFFIVKVNRFSQQIKDYLIDNPFISLEGNSLIGNMYIYGHDNHDFGAIANEYKCKGLCEVKITFLTDEKRKKKPFRLSGPPAN